MTMHEPPEKILSVHGDPTASGDERGDENLARLGEAYADSLDRGLAPADSIIVKLDQAEPRLIECLQRLDQQWPDKSSVESPDDGRSGRHGAADDGDGLPLPVEGSALSKIGRFVIEREVGRGGFGVVFLARDPTLGRPVALKVPRLETLLSPEGRERFLKEARMTAALDHPHIISVFELGQDGPLCYIASAYCAGPNLAQWLATQERRCQPKMAATLVLRLAEAVEHAHNRGVLHCDLKPSNVMLESAADSADGELPFCPKLTDFGLGGMLDPALADTRSSIILGTPLYMAPEQLSPTGERLRETDVYGLGAILYEILAGRPPHDGEGVAAVFDAIRRDALPSPARFNRGVPRDLATICLKCLRGVPGDRYRAAGELADDLRRYLAGEAIEVCPIGYRVRLTRWARRPQRLREAGVVTIVINLSLLGWLVVDFPIALGLEPQFFPGVGAALQDQMAVIGVHLVGVATGVSMLRTKRWALWVGTGLSVANLTAVVLVLAGLVEPFAEFYRDAALRVMVFSMLGSMFTVWACFCIMIAVARSSGAGGRQ